ncbi:aminotransferase class I/II-fold pyridoxal phosphate-dependent enzyme [Pilimelia columellifera]|uniref:aminotransferase class I/II-fold pyridoxal phosphate-dependent enzyme n=1 Tax=Pilimelia columellifera TaxID=706574 RepID=UPI0031DD9F01
MSRHYQITGASAAALVASIETGVHTGALPAGTALPAVRALAADLGVAPGTVAKAYQDLRQRGIIETAGRNGTRVRPRPPVTHHSALAAAPAGVTDLSVGDPDPRLLPGYATALATLVDHPVTYRDGGPLPALVTAARERLRADGLPDGQIAITNGALDGIDRILAAHLRPGDRVAVEDPGWANLLDLLAAHGLRPVSLPVDDAGPTADGLRRALTNRPSAVIITSRAQNPTGGAVTADRARALAALLRAHPDLLTIEDDHAAELAHEPLSVVAGATGRWAFVRSVSKPYGPDLRLAVVTGDPDTVARVDGRLRITAGWVSTLLQRLVLALWTDPDVTATLTTARDSYAHRRLALVAALADRGVAAHGRTGINVWIPVPDETAAVAGLRDHGYAVAPGARHRTASPAGIRVTVSPLEPGDIATFADAVAAALRGPAGGSTR